MTSRKIIKNTKQIRSNEIALTTTELVTVKTMFYCGNAFQIIYSESSPNPEQ
jgi:hypothetical protein